MQLLQFKTLHVKPLGGFWSGPAIYTACSPGALGKPGGFGVLGATPRELKLTVRRMQTRPHSGTVLRASAQYLIYSFQLS